ncbi:MAG: ASKHA domain-containing protein [Candidatus Caldatribacteriota bacterium]|nr:ASKHA domain-containing protein [Candidatus Caldatribacteriota bacterium]
MIKITFLPDKKNIEANEGITVLEALERAGINIDTPCGGKGICGKCKILINKGITAATQIEEEEVLSEEEIKKGFRLACQTKLFKDTIIEIPSEIRLDFKKVFSSNLKGDINRIKNNLSLGTNLKKVFLDLGKPSLDDQRPDWERIKDGLSSKKIENISNLKVAVEILKKIPDVIRKSDFKITVTLQNNEIIDIEKGDTTKNSYGIAFDIGTTTVAGYLVNLKTGEELSAVAKTNPQVVHGDDVISRIGFTQKQKENLEILQKEIVNTLNEIIKETTQRIKINRSNIYETVIVGNTCMHHLFLGLDPSNIAPSPYIPVIKESLSLKARDIPELALKPSVNVYMLPNISAFVGADIVAGILSTSMWREDKIILFVDLGTNGEIVLGSRERLWTCSTAAGPAFEGARISAGMRAAEGAIYKVKVDNKFITYKAIKDGKARGICGSGLIDLIAELVKLGLITKSGKLIDREECDPNLSEEIKKRIINGQKGNKFLLVKGKETENEKPIYITQRDIREVQLAKAAIFAGIKILLKEVNIPQEDIQKILLAGAFGNFIDKESAIRMGLIPRLPLKKIESVGNAAGRGAEIVLLSEKTRKICEKISKDIKYVELSSRPDFQEEFVEAMFF